MQLWMVARQATVLKNAPDSGRGRLLTRTPTITPPTTQPRQVLDRGNNREKHLEKAARDAKLRGRRAVGEDVGDQSLPTAAGSDDSLAASEFQEVSL